MYAIFNKASNFIRWRDWGPGKIPVFCTLLAYIALANHNFAMGFLIYFVLFMLFAVIHSALGYVLNDWGDREIDRLHGKPNAFENLSHFQGIAALAILFIMALLSGLPFVRRPFVLPLWLGWAFFALAYSLKPLRLKERGIWGLGFSSVAQWTLPIILTFAAMERFGKWDMIVFAIANTISGATLEVAHQRYDRAYDLSTQTNTFGMRTDPAKLNRLYVVALFLDKIALGVVLITIFVGIAPLTQGTGVIRLGVPLLAIYLALLAIALFENIRASTKGEFLDPYYSNKHSANKLLHETMPNLALPGYLLLLVTIFQPVNGILLLAFLCWRLMLGQADWQWPLRALQAWLSK
jgi:4-hydroxybenzoate polyprenyltransferase